MGVSVQDFTANIGKKTPPPLLLFTSGKPAFGKEDFEPYLADVAIDKMIAAYVDPGMRDLALTIAYADETDPGQVAEEARTMPFLVERRVILVRNGNVYMGMSSEKRSPLAPLLECVESPPESTILMMVAPGADKRKRLYKAFEANGVIIECPQLNDRALAVWVREQVTGRGFTINTAAVSALIDRVGGRLSDMLNAINLICNYVSGKSSAITETDVLAACADVAEATVWALTDAIAHSNVTAALEALHELVSMNRAPDEIMGTINWLLEAAYRAHPDTQPTIGNRFVADKVTPLAHKFSVKRLIEALALCTRTHLALRSTGANHHLLLEMLIIKLAKARS